MNAASIAFYTIMVFSHPPHVFNTGGYQLIGKPDQVGMERACPRITSYNVCYTKLLRKGGLGIIGNPAGGCVQPMVSELNKGQSTHGRDPVISKDFVITSYSIHYTKLYEKGINLFGFLYR